jgi:hypothetical protein
VSAAAANVVAAPRHLRAPSVNRAAAAVGKPPRIYVRHRAPDLRSSRRYDALSSVNSFVISALNTKKSHVFVCDTNRMRFFIARKYLFYFSHVS